ncbi:MAG: DUF3109 family protein [Bacteroidales bacterium]|nr:DUF3109 family protein [Bacteroidales bacterium]
MIAIDNTINSDDLGKVCFVCNLGICKGACCVEGDAGAPLDEQEISELEDNLDYIKPFMNQAGIEVIEQTGVFDYDSYGHYVTPLVNGIECAFVVFNEEGIAGCAIEQAWEAGKSKFRKPVSCHLYPVRISRYNDFDAVNYHQWHICRPALELGKKLDVPLYVFLKDSLIRKYGEKWYEKLCSSIEQPGKQV